MHVRLTEKSLVQGLAVIMLFLSNMLSAWGFNHVGEIKSGGMTFLRYKSNTLQTEYFISRAKQNAPILLYIQGSGCRPVFLSPYQGDYMSSVFSLLDAAAQGRFAVMVVNKPFVSYEKSVEQKPRKHGCSAQYHNQFSYDNWLQSISGAYLHAMSLPFTKKDKALVIGISEGAVMASGLAKHHASISHLGLIGATYSQLFDFNIQAFEGESDTAILKGIEGNSKIISNILANPSDSTQFVWGHSYLRWSSFLRVFTAKNLEGTDAKIRLISGMQDASVPITSTEALYSTLYLSGKDVDFFRVPEASHSLMVQGASDIMQVQSYFSDIRNWYFDSVNE